MVRRYLCVISGVILIYGFSLAASDNEREISERQIRLKRGSEVGVVQKKVFKKKFRFEVTPIMVGSIINDPFIDSYFFGVGFGGHFSDWFGLEFLYYKCNSTDNDLNRILQNDYGKEVVAGKPEYTYMLNVLLTPIYGKLALIADFILHFDTYFAPGYGMTKTHFESNSIFSLGLGQRFYLNKWMAFRLDVKNYIHEETRSSVTISKNNLLVTLGISMFFPRRK